MNDALRVGTVESIGDLNSQIEYLIQRKRLSGNGMLEGCPIQELHFWDKRENTFA